MLAKHLTERFAYVLVDSRTGLTDTSGICTSLFPDKLVVVFTPNRQSILGSLEVISEAARYRRESDDLRPFWVFPLPSRIDVAKPRSYSTCGGKGMRHRAGGGISRFLKTSSERFTIFRPVALKSILTKSKYSIFPIMPTGKKSLQ